MAWKATVILTRVTSTSVRLMTGNMRNIVHWGCATTTGLRSTCSNIDTGLSRRPPCSATPFRNDEWHVCYPFEQTPQVVHDDDWSHLGWFPCIWVCAAAHLDVHRRNDLRSRFGSVHVHVCEDPEQLIDQPVVSSGLTAYLTMTVREGFLQENGPCPGIPSSTPVSRTQPSRRDVRPVRSGW